jgi:adenosylhomocysteine nucleosidase
MTNRVQYGFVFAMPMEAAGVVDLLESRETTKGNSRVFHRGILGKVSVAIVESGVGQKKAAEAAKVLFDVFCPDFILSAGYAGGLAPDLKPFTIVQPKLLLRQSDGMILNIANDKPQLLPAAGQSLLDQKAVAVRDSPMLVTTDKPVAKAEDKLLLGRATGAGLVDMETFAVAEFCRNYRASFYNKNNDKNDDKKDDIATDTKETNQNEIGLFESISFSSIRIILDAADEELPKEIQQIMQSAEKSTARLAGTTISSIFRRPSLILDLYKLKEKALKATDLLAKYIKNLVNK